MNLPKIVRDGRFVILDIESTGLSRKKDEPVQLAFGHMDGGRAGLRGFYTFKPGVPIKPRAAAIHGFTERKLTWAPSFAQCGDEIYSLLKDRIVLGYNVRRFDVPIVARMFEESGVKCSLSRHVAWRIRPRILDVLVWQRRFAKQQGWEGGNSLGVAAQRWNVDVADLHDAWQDCRVTWALFWALANRFPELGEMDPDEAVIYEECGFQVEEVRDRFI